MIEAGINNGFVFMWRAEASENKTILLILYKGQNTVKEVKLTNAGVPLLVRLSR
jgi:hypothetical protein